MKAGTADLYFETTLLEREVTWHEATQKAKELRQTAHFYKTGTFTFFNNYTKTKEEIMNPEIIAAAAAVIGFAAVIFSTIRKAIKG